MATAEQIIRRVLVRCGWPTTNAPLSDAEILELVDDEITSTLWPQLLETRGDWHMARRDYTLVPGQALYRLPAKVWGPLKELHYVDSSGKARDLPVINIGELGRLATDSRPNNAPYFAYVDGDSLGLHPVPDNTDISLRIIYRREPNVMCLASAAKQVTEILTDTRLEVEDVGDWLDDTEIDFISQGNGHQVLLDEIAIDVASGTEINTPVSLAAIEVGDWLSLTGTTPVAPVPNNMVPQLCDRVAMAAMNSNGDQAGFNRNAAVAKEREARGKVTLEPRVEAEPEIIVPHSSPWR